MVRIVLHSCEFNFEHSQNSPAAGIQGNDDSQQNKNEVSFVPTRDSETNAANTKASVNSS
jgi:hypothetical protein